MTETHLQTRSSTAVVLEELQLYGWHPFTDEPDPRPLPEPDAIRTAVADIFDALVSTLSDTRLLDRFMSTDRGFAAARKTGSRANHKKPDPSKPLDTDHG